MICKSIDKSLTIGETVIGKVCPGDEIDNTISKSRTSSMIVIPADFEGKGYYGIYQRVAPCSIENGVLSHNAHWVDISKEDPAWGLKKLVDALSAIPSAHKDLCSCGTGISGFSGWEQLKKAKRLSDAELKMSEVTFDIDFIWEYICNLADTGKLWVKVECVGSSTLSIDRKTKKVVEKVNLDEHGEPKKYVNYSFFLKKPKI